MTGTLKSTMQVRFHAKAAALTLLAFAGVLAVACTAAPGAPQAPAARSGTSGYPWPIRPFDRPHAVRAVVGDPRTTFLHAVGGDALAGSGVFSFHNGVDIDAPHGARVYPVVSGTVQSVRKGYSVVVRAPDGRLFSYVHIAPIVRMGQPVTARHTVLGHIKNWALELHFTEVSPGGEIVNPLVPRHLTPYRDSTRPVATGLTIRDGGRTIPPFAVHGRVKLIADAYDLPEPVRSSTRFARDGFGVAPAAVTWSLTRLRGHSIVARATAVDFRRALPKRSAFWSVYARGTYQNRAPITPRYHQEMPGRYLFLLTALDTRKLRDGVYIVNVTAIDAQGNQGELTTRIEIRNADAAV